jgi:L-ascorbate peroxidase
MASASSIAAPKTAAPLRARRAANAPSVRAATTITRCAANNDGSSRRDALLQLASLAAAPALLTPTQPAAANVASIYKYEPVDALPPAILDSGNAKVPIAAALRAQTVYAGYAVPIIEKNVTVPLGTLISLAARDAGTFDASTNTGGLNGSIRFELDRPENKKVRAFFVL